MAEPKFTNAIGPVSSPGDILRAAARVLDVAEKERLARLIEEPSWQQKAMERAAFARGVSAMRDVAVTVIRARHESGYACEPWTLVEAIRAAKEPTDPCGVGGLDRG